ncbi:TonB-dependent receptor domain-containing protein [Gramella sp. KN1008]|uniref:TonB-dependent receptor n=1 Tax=Gramella sp. KN1008 TaxID=2529298 RepID=UPI00103FD71A|nr:TonB-dependent receptor [Gramella sp. KN1008]TBW27578.1 TonB-dependent receptor [Gramella sp. KN1008]
MNKFLLVLCGILCVNFLAGQEVAGEIRDIQTGELLRNVRVEVVGSGKTVFSDSMGYFSLSQADFPLGLRFSIPGYTNKEIRLNSSGRNIKVFLKRRIDQLSEVILRSPNIPKKLIRTPAAVSLISKADLQRTSNINLVEDFNYLPGVYVNQGALNTNKINIRGVGSRAQYSTNRIKAYINAIPLTTAEGDLTLDDFDPEFLDRIEIVKGPVSSLFGAGLGGAVNLYTERITEDERSVSGDFTYASFNTRKSRMNITYVKDSLDISVNYNKIDSEGYRDNGEYNRISMTANAGLLSKKGNYWSFLYSYTNIKAFIPSSLNETDFLNTPEKAAFTWAQSAGYESYSKNIIGLSYQHIFTKKFRNETSVFYNARDGYEPRPFNILDDVRSSVGMRTRFNLETSLLERSAEFSFGSEAMLEWYDMATFENLYEESEKPGSIQGELLSKNHQARDYVNIFGQMNMDITEKLLLELGFNFNSTAYSLEDDFPDDDVDQSGDYSFDPVFSPRLGLSYEALPEKNLYISISHGFSTPTVEETLTPEGLINTDLQTEKGWNYEVGFKGSWFNHRLYTEASLYSIHISDLLVARRVGQDQYVGINAGKAQRKGIEFSSSFNTILAEDWQLNLFLNSNFNFFKYEQFVDRGEDYSGNEIPGTPEYLIAPGMEVKLKDFSAKFNYQAFGEIALNDENTEYTSAYQLLNLKLDYDLTLSRDLALQLNFGIINLLDEHYAASVVTNAVGFGGSAPRYYYPGNPRNYFGGMSVKYEL